MAKSNFRVSIASNVTKKKRIKKVAGAALILLFVLTFDINNRWIMRSFTKLLPLRGKINNEIQPNLNQPI